jgi:phage-related protein
VARIAEAFVDIKPDLKGFESTLSKGVGDAVQKTGTAISKTGSTLTKSVTLPIAGAFGVALARTNDVEKSMREVVTLTGEVGAVADATFAEFRSGVTALSSELGVSQSVLTGGLYQALSAGVPRENVFEFMRVATQASIAGTTDAETAVDGLTTIINAFGLQSTDAQRVADAMFTAVKGGKTTFDELSNAMFQAAPIAASVGLEFEEVLGAVAALTGQGTPTSVAMTQIRATLSELSKEGTKVSDVFKDAAGVGFRDFIAQGGTMQEALGILSDVAGPAVSGAFADLNNDASDLAKTFQSRAGVSFRDFVNEGGSVADALALIEDQTGPMSATLADLFGSVEAGGAALALTGTASEKFTQEMEAQANATGAAGAAFAEIDKARAFERLKTSLDNLSVAAGEILIPAITSLIEIVSPWIAAFGNLDDGTKKIIIGVLGVAAVLGPILIVIGKVVIIVGKLAGAIGFLVSPVGLVVLAIAAIIAIIILVVKNFDKIKAVVKQVTDAVVRFFKAALDKIKGFLSGFFDIVKNVFNSIKDFVGGVFDAIAGFFSSMVDKIVGFLQAFKDVFMDIWNTIVGFLESVFRVFEVMFAIVLGIYILILESIFNAFKSIWDAISEYVFAVFDFIKEAFQAAMDVIIGILNWFAGIFEAVWGAISGVFQAFADLSAKVWGKVFDVFLDVLKKFKDIFDSVFGAISRVFKTVTDTLRAVWDATFNAFLDVARPILDAIMGAFDKLWGGITGIFDKIKSTAQTVFNSVKDFAVGAFDTVLSTIKTVVNGILSGIESGLNFGVGAINKLIRNANRVPGVNIGEISEISLPRLANGAIVGSPMLAQIGEAGAEAVIPLTRPRRALQLMEESGLADLVRNNRTQMGGPAVNIQNATFVKGTDADLVAQKVLAAWRARSVA